MKNIIVCDLDGTLANCEHRVHHVRNKPKNWDAFYAGVREDEVNDVVLNVLDKFISYEGSLYDIIFCTGRPERCRADTEWWFREVPTTSSSRRFSTITFQKTGCCSCSMTGSKWSICGAETG